MVLQTAVTAATGVHAMGIDVGGPALEVAQRGLRSMLSNRMAQLGHWSVGGDRPELELADDLIDHLLQRERATADVVVGVAAPSWFGAAERTLLADAIDPGRSRDLVACSTPLAAVIGSRLLDAGTDPRADRDDTAPKDTAREDTAPQDTAPDDTAPDDTATDDTATDDTATDDTAPDDTAVGMEHPTEVVLALDLDLGFSASIVEVAPGVVAERGTVGLSLRQLRAENAGAGIVPGTRQRARALSALVTAAAGSGVGEVTHVVAVGDDSTVAVRAMLAEADQAWASDVPVTVVRSRAAVARGAAFVAEADAAAAAGAPTWHVSSCLGRTLGVLTDGPDHGEHTGPGAADGVVHPVLVRGAALPAVREQPFDLGPDDGLDVYLDLYEQLPLGATVSPADHRVVATARYRHEARHSPQVTVVFSADRAGRVRIGPDEAWVTDWRDTEVGIRRVPRVPSESSRALGRSRSVRSLVGGGAVVRPLKPATSASSMPSDDVAGDVAGVVAGVVAGDVAGDGATAAATPRSDAPRSDAPRSDAPAAPAAPAPVAPPGESSRDDSPERSSVQDPERDDDHLSPPAVVAALQRCERLLSHEVGRMVALRSAFALLGCRDDATPATLAAAADVLEAGLRGRDDELADALRQAVAAVRDELGRGGSAWYFGGTVADVVHELGRVVEHLVVVVGFVSAAEQRRLVLDAMLLGLDPTEARATVRQLVARAQADRVDATTGDLDDRCRTVRLRPGLQRFVLDDPSGSAAPPPAGGSGGVTMRVLLDLR